MAPLRRLLSPAAPIASRYELACRIADVFDQYLVYRPDWIRRWEAGRRGLASRRCWRSSPRRRLHVIASMLLEALAPRARRAASTRRAAAARRGLRRSVAAAASLEVLARLADTADVHLLLVNP